MGNHCPVTATRDGVPCPAQRLHNWWRLRDTLQNRVRLPQRQDHRSQGPPDISPASGPHAGSRPPLLLAYYVERYIGKALAPILFDDHEPEAAGPQRSSPVDPGNRSPAAHCEARRKQSDSGPTVHSLRSVIYQRGSTDTSHGRELCKSQRDCTICRLCQPTTSESSVPIGRANCAVWWELTGIVQQLSAAESHHSAPITGLRFDYGETPLTEARRRRSAVCTGHPGRHGWTRGRRPRAARCLITKLPHRHPHRQASGYTCTPISDIHSPTHTDPRSTSTSGPPPRARYRETDSPKQPSRNLGLLPGNFADIFDAVSQVML